MPALAQGALHQSVQYTTAGMVPCTTPLDCSWCCRGAIAVQRIAAPATEVAQQVGATVVSWQTATRNCGGRVKMFVELKVLLLCTAPA